MRVIQRFGLLVTGGSNADRRLRSEGFNQASCRGALVGPFTFPIGRFVSPRPIDAGNPVGDLAGSMNDV